ncbi:stationary-phase-induced ribosome-associated protein [Serratia ureilytica]
MIKAKSNRKARRLFGMAHWKSNKFKVAISETAAGEKWKVVKKRNSTDIYRQGNNIHRDFSTADFNNAIAH